MSKRNYHVTPGDDGQWRLIREGADRASSVHDTQLEAIERGRELARESAVDLRIHGRDGRIRDSDSYGSDPFPPQDRKH